MRDIETGIVILNKSKNKIKFKSTWDKALNFDSSKSNYVKIDKSFEFELINLNNCNIVDLSNYFFEIFIINEIIIYDYTLKIIAKFKKQKIDYKYDYYFDFKDKIIYQKYNHYLKKNKKFVRLFLMFLFGSDFCYNNNDIFKTHLNSHFIEYKVLFLYKISHILQLNKILPYKIKNILKSLLSYARDQKIDIISRL